MKPFLFVLFSGIIISTFAQTPASYQYAVARICPFSPLGEHAGMHFVLLDYGQAVPFGRNARREKQGIRMAGGELIRFNSTAHALNYLSEMGWELLTVTDEDEDFPYFYLRRLRNTAYDQGGEEQK